MTSPDINRRDLMKSVGVSSLAATGVVQGFRREELGKARIIETGIVYAIPERDDYHEVHLDERYQYYVHPETHEVNVFKVPNLSKKALVDDDIVVNGDEMAATAPPTSITDTEPSRLLPTELGSYFRRTRGVILENPRPERPFIARLTGQRIQLEANEFAVDHPPGETRTYELPTTRMTVETKTVTDELVDAEEIPENQRSRKTEYGTVTVEATPTLHVRDRGEMTIVDLEEMG